MEIFPRTLVEYSRTFFKQDDYIDLFNVPVGKMLPGSPQPRVLPQQKIRRIVNRKKSDFDMVKESFQKIRYLRMLLKDNSDTDRVYSSSICEIELTVRKTVQK